MSWKCGEACAFADGKAKKQSNAVTSWDQQAFSLESEKELAAIEVGNEFSIAMKQTTTNLVIQNNTNLFLMVSGGQNPLGPNQSVS